ncbi:MAG: translation elongation factor Ts [Chitinispirillales bacterium]|jgi:elongation factor Ts|nr:translation elongation factor Ts [Chitinispirillales bacterium]
MNIPASEVKALRDKTGLGMMDCKQALIDANGDIELAIANLRKKGELTAAKRAGKAAKEGKVSILVDDTCGIVYEVNSETDFVARNDDFLAFIDVLGKLLLAQKPADHAAALQLVDASIGGITVEAKVTELVGKIGENIMFRRYAKIDADPSKEKIFSYIHGGGKFGVMIKFEASSAAALSSPELAQLGEDLALQVTMASPLAVDADGISEETIAKEKEVFLDQVKTSGKPENIWEKIVEGKFAKYYEEVTLVNQKSIRYEEKSVKEIIAETSKAIGADVKPLCFVRFELGAEE